MKIAELIITFKYFQHLNNGLINGRTKAIYFKITDNKSLPSYADLEKECLLYLNKNLSRCEYFGIMEVKKIYMIVNEDRVKPILEELGITIKDDWKTIHVLNNDKQEYCYYYTFEHNKKVYCVSGDSYSFVFSQEGGYFLPRFLYRGYDIEKLKQTIKRVLK